MYQLPEKLRALKPYDPITGEYPIRLDANESFLSLPDALRAEISGAIERLAFHRYPDPYCEKLCAGFAGFYGVDASRVVAGNGSDELIGLIVGSFLQAGERMVTVSPDFSMYSFYAQLSGVQVSAFVKPELTLDAAQLIAFTEKQDAQMLILSNPCNPTSLCASRETVVRLVEGLPDRLVVVDEAYMDFSDGSVIDLIERYDNLLVLKTCSKAFGMAGIRLGFAVAGEPITNALKAAKSPYNVNAMTQVAGEVLFSHPDYLQSCIEQIKASRAALYTEMCAIADSSAQILRLEESCANFVFLQLKDAPGTFAALKAQGIVVRQMGERLRISAGAPEENRAVCDALRKLLN